MQRTATAGFYAGFVGQGIEYTQIISNADYQLSMIITSAKGVNSINNPLSYLLFIKDFSLTQTIDAAKAGLQDAWNGTYDSAIGRKIGAVTPCSLKFLNDALIKSSIIESLAPPAFNASLAILVCSSKVFGLPLSYSSLNNSRCFEVIILWSNPLSLIKF
jgi:hypothetical protein